MVRCVMAFACAVSAFALSASAQAQSTRFSFDFTAPIYSCWSWEDGEHGCDANSTVTGSGFLNADDNGDGTFSITDIIGKVSADVGDPALDITGFSGGQFGAMGDPTISLVDGGYQLDNVTLFYEGEYSSQFLSLWQQGDGTLGGWGMDGTDPIGATFNIAPAAAVPEVATWGLMLIGFGATGAAMRRRRASVTFA